MAVTAWTKHCKTPEEKTQYLESLRRAEWLLSHIKQLINENAASFENTESSTKIYDNPNWSFRQAHANGYRQALRDFNKLLTLDPQDNK